MLTITAGKNLRASSVSGLKMTSVRCPINGNKLKCLYNVNKLMGC